MEAAEEACRSYQKRFRIETFFADHKSRGFHRHKSHIADPQRLSRLLIAACLAYIWIIYLGSVCEGEGWRASIHRMKRCDLSLFQLGMRLLEYFLNEELSVVLENNNGLLTPLSAEGLPLLRSSLQQDVHASCQEVDPAEPGS